MPSLRAGPSGAPFLPKLLLHKQASLGLQSPTIRPPPPALTKFARLKKTEFVKAKVSRPHLCLNAASPEAAFRRLDKDLCPMRSFPYGAR